jgi:3-oxoacyl-[acyl-carrier protein] reductase
LRKSVAQLRAELLGVTPIEPTSGHELRGLRALVTGSTSGIGRAIALRLARGGADVIIHGRRSSAAEEVAAEVRRAGGNAAAILADLSDSAARDDLAARAWQQWAGLDVLISNAGVDTLTGQTRRWSFERKLQELLSVDVCATIQLSRALGARMRQAGQGVIVNMGWDQAETGMEGDSGELFATVKGAVMAFSRSLALSLAPQVRVHCLAPGWIRTAWGESASEGWQERVEKETPLRRWGTPQDVAETAAWLVSPAARYLDAQIVRVNGGAVR